MPNEKRPESDQTEAEHPTLAPHNQSADDPTIPPISANGDDATLPPMDTDATVAPGQGSPEASIGDRIKYFGDYELLEEIARGGMGVVYKARQINLNRIVALKMILAGQFAGSEDVQRFYTEAEAAANLDHPGIVPIYEIGEHQGQHYFSMGFIEGTSLAEEVFDGPLDPMKTASLLRHVSLAMAYAHSRGVIHRDLKPANILVDQSGQPKVTDFGLAKQTQADSDLTGTGQILGTPAFMPPEQAAGKIEDIGPLADVYSLGAVLYCLMTGRPPFQAANAMDTLLQVLDREVVVPSALVPQIPTDLETICLKCLEKEPRARYQSAQELADELDRFIKREPILARPISRSERAWRWCKRKPAQAGLCAAASALLLLLSVGGPTVAWKQSQYALNEKRLREQANQEKERSDRHLYNAQMNLIQRYWEEGNVSNALDLLQRQIPTANRLDLRQFEWYYFENLLQRDATSLHVSDDPVYTVAYSANGRWLAAASWGDIRIWHAETGKLAQNQPVDVERSLIWDIEFSPDSSVLAWISDNALEPPTVEFWSVVEQKRLRPIPLSGPTANRIAFGSDGRTLIVAVDSMDDGGEAQLWDLPTFQNAVTFRHASGFLTSVAAAPDNQSVISAGGTSPNLAPLTAPEVTDSPDLSSFAIRQWDPQTGKLIRTLPGHTQQLTELTFSRDGKRIASAGYDNRVVVWDAATGDRITEYDNSAGTASSIQGLAFNPDASQVAFCSGEVIKFMDSETGKIQRQLRGHSGNVYDVVFSPSGRQLLSGSEDGMVRHWELQGNKPLQWQLPKQNLRGARIVGAEKRGCAWNFDSAYLFDTRNRTMKTISRSGANQGVAINSAGTVAVVAYQPRPTSDGPRTSLKVIETETLAVTWSSEEYSGLLGMSTDGRWVAVTQQQGGQSRTVLLDAVNGEELSSFDATSFCFASDPASDLVALGTFDPKSRERKMRVWKVSKKRELFAGDHEHLIKQIAFGEHQIASTDGSVTKIWDRATGDLQLELKGHLQGAISSIAFLPADRLVSAGTDKQVKLWDTISGQEILTLNHPESVIAMSVAESGEEILALGMDGIVVSWVAKRGNDQ